LLTSSLFPPPRCSHALLFPSSASLLVSSIPAAREREGWFCCLALVHLVNLRD
jgi:hypothetical protein